MTEALVEVGLDLEPLGDERGVELELGKISGSGVKVTVVPVPRAAPASSTRPGRLAPLELLLVRRAVAADLGDELLDRALTTLAPTPCRPPATL